MMRETRLDRLSAGEVALALLLCVLPVALMRPWTLPFPPLDYSAFLPVLRPTDSYLEAFTALSRMSAASARRFPLWNTWLAAEWRLFGEDVVMWHMVQIGVFAGCVVLLFHRIRRAGASRSATAAGVGCALLAGSVSSALSTPDAAEPFGLAWILLSLVAADRLRDPARFTTAAILVAIAATAAAMVKEPFIVGAAAAAIYGAYVIATSGVDPRSVRRRVAVLVLFIFAGVMSSVVIPSALLARQARNGTQGERYSVASIDAARVLNVGAGMFLPVTRNPIFPANVAYVGLAALGLGVGFYRRRLTTSAAATLVSLLALPFFAMLGYLPWPAFPGYYGLLGLPAIATVLALSFEGLRDSPKIARAGAVLMAAALVVYGLIISSAAGSLARAEGRLERRLIDAIRERAAGGLVVVRDQSVRDYALALAQVATIDTPANISSVSYTSCTAGSAACSGRHRAATVVMAGAPCLETCVEAGALSVVSECAVAVDYKRFRPVQRCLTAAVSARH